MSKADLEKHRKSSRYARYTCPVVKLQQEEVDKVHICLLTEMKESVTFRTPARMLRFIRRWRKHARETGLGLKILVPPNVMPPFEKSLPQYLFDTIAILDPKFFLRTERKYDFLEKELIMAINRTHFDNEMQTGQVRERSKKECWALEKSDQPAKLSWRRSARKETESSIGQ
jgi:hypothetical protein